MNYDITPPGAYWLSTRTVTQELTIHMTVNGFIRICIKDSGYNVEFITTREEATDIAAQIHRTALGK